MLLLHVPWVWKLWSLSFSKIWLCASVTSLVFKFQTVWLFTHYIIITILFLKFECWIFMFFIIITLSFLEYRYWWCLYFSLSQIFWRLFTLHWSSIIEGYTRHGTTLSINTVTSISVYVFFWGFSFRRVFTDISSTFIDMMFRSPKD